MNDYRNLQTGALAVLLIFMIGCAGFTQHGRLESSAREAYAGGDYDTAVFECTRSLKLNPDYEKAQILIGNAFRAATQAHAARLAGLEASSSKSRWDGIVQEYEALVKINQAVRELPTLKVKETGEVIEFETSDYTQHLVEAKTNAAEAHYQEGLSLLEREGVDEQRGAALEFRLATSFIEDYKDAAELYEKARQAGVKRMAIVPFEDRSGKEGRYGDLPGLVVDEIVTEFMNDPSSMEFLELVSREELENVMEEHRLTLAGIVDEESAVQLGKILGIHEILTGRITQVIYTPTTTLEKNVEREARIVVGKEKYKDSKGNIRTKEVYEKVSAVATIYTRTAAAKITGSFRIIDVETARLKKGESFEGISSFEYRWATFKGDRRALDFGTMVLLRRNEKSAPVEGEMVNRATKDLSNSLSRTLKRYTM
ncbi:MAG: CsgG/HfaB family protein [Candidatus Neomarinimicrobiota bacterium]